MRVTYGVIWVSLVVLLCACTYSNQGNGQILMTAYSNEELGVKTVVPMRWNEAGPGTFIYGESLKNFGILSIASMPGASVEEAVETLMQSITVTEEPQKLGDYKSPGLTWQLYSLAFDEEGLATLKGKLALAENNSSIYVVFVGSILHNYEKTPAIYDTVFSHVLHAFTPMEGQD